MRVRSGETPRSPVAKPPVSVERPASKRGGATGRSATSSEACSVVKTTRASGPRGSRAGSSNGEGQGRHQGSWSGCRGTLRRRGRGTVRRLPWELERPYLAPGRAGTVGSECPLAFQNAAAASHSRVTGRPCEARSSGRAEGGTPATPPAEPGSLPAYNRQREGAGSREGVGGGRSSDDGWDNTTRPERRAPASSTRVAEGNDR